jgi:hypothetical protein
LVQEGVDDWDKSASFNARATPRRSTSSLGVIEGSMAVCTVTYSAEVARRAYRTFFWRKFSTPLGLFYLLSLPINLALLVFVYLFMGTNWVLGAFGVLFIGTLYIQAVAYFAMPRAMARAAVKLNAAEIETTSKGFRASIGPNVSFLDWARFKYVWVYPDFVILVGKPELLFRFAYVPAIGMSAEARRDFEDAGK